MDNFTKLQQLNDKNLQAAESRKRHSELLLDNTATQEVIVKSFAKLVEYLDNKVSKTEVVNQLREIGTPDVENVVTALASLHDTLKTHENTDLTEITSVMQGVLDEVKQLPKENPELPEQKFVDYSKQLTALEKSIQTVEKAIKAQELKVDAPIVNVPETVVNVEKPDLKPLEKSIDTSGKDVVKAVKGIKIPEFKTDPIEKLLKKTNKLLEDLPDFMPSGGSSGLGWVAVDTNGTPVPIQLDASGKLPVASSAATNYTTRIEEDSGDANITYIGNAVIGSAEASAVWQIKRLDATTGLIKLWRDGNDSYDNAWSTREAGSYS